MKRDPYEFGSDCPWGWQLRTRSERGLTVIVGNDGRSYRSIRDVFWQVRLAMNGYDVRVRDEQLERMLAVLASMQQNIVLPIESAHTLFQGESEYRRFYNYWLYSEGLITSEYPSDPLHAKVTDEGIAVLRMLALTRPLSLNAIPIGEGAVTALGPPGSASECNRARFDKMEGRARRLPFAFVRERLFGAPVISLLHRDIRDDIPLARTLWNMPFLDEGSRDRMYEWMYGRLDRWTIWGELAQSRGGEALTQTLLALIVLSDGPHQSRSADAEGSALAIMGRP